jgi:hypothetical protein
MIQPPAKPTSHPVPFGRPTLRSAALVLAVLTAGIASASSLAAQPQQPHQLCKSGHNYDQSKGLCYDPAVAYKADIPKKEGSSGEGFFSGLGLGLGGISFCQYGDKHVGSGDQAYCESRRTGEAYPASR